MILTSKFLKAQHLYFTKKAALDQMWDELLFRQKPFSANGIVVIEQADQMHNDLIGRQQNLLKRIRILDEEFLQITKLLQPKGFAKVLNYFGINAALHFRLDNFLESWSKYEPGWPQ